MNRIEFTAACGPAMGLGHLNRCLTLASALRALGAEVRIRIHGQADPALLATAAAGISWEEFAEADALSGALERAWEGDRPDLLITDAYSLPPGYWSGLRRRFPSVPHLAFDDAGEKSGLPVTALIHPHPGGEGAAGAFGGARYVLVREAVAQARNRGEGSLSARNPGFPVLTICFGGSDPEGQTERVALALRKPGSPDAEIRLVLGPAFGDASAVERAAGGHARMRVLKAPPDWAATLAGSDLILCGGGSVCYEALCLGVPVCVMRLAPNQRAAAEAVAAAGCGWDLGDFRSLEDAGLVRALAAALADPAALRSRGARAAALIDGRGGERLAADLSAFMAAWHGDRFPVGEVRDEYESASREGEEFRKLKWGSQAGMLNAFRIAGSKVRWESVRDWLDIGSGTGAFLAEIEKERTVEAFTGLDLSPSLARYAASRRYRGPSARFGVGDFLAAGKPDTTHDLVTLIGVLQKCGASLRKAVGRAAERVRPGGQLFLTTKNLDWKRFREPGFLPEADHHWFSVAELREALACAGLEVRELRAFEPRTGEILASPEDGHTVYALAEKPL